MLQKLTLKQRMWLLLGTFFLSIVTTLIVVLPGLDAVRIGGPFYTDISNSKDLIADILPPPLYVIESHLAAQEFISSSSQDERAEHLEKLRKLRQDVTDRKAYWENIDFNPEIKSQLFGAVIPTAEKFIDEMLADLPKIDSDMTPSQEESVDVKIDTLFDAHLSEVNKLVEMATRNGREAEISGMEISTRTARLAQIVSIVALVLALSLGILIARSVMRELGGDPAEVRRIAGSLAKGELDVQITIHRGDTSSVMVALQDTVSQLRSVVLRIREATDTINTASNEIASGNSDLSSRTEEQASSLEETASSMEELTSTVKQNADNAKQANQLAVSASDIAQRGGTVVGDVVTTMSAIHESARKIVDIITVIDGIAFQTNILALNAAVEAARAGEQGRGFAVVAGEVRNLAQRSAAAAKEIKTLISDSVEKVETGNKLVSQAGDTMQEVVNAIRRVTDLMSEIAAASQEQSRGIEQVGSAITQMDEVTQQNAALVEQAAAAAESLEDQARQLVETVRYFETGANQALSAAPTRTASRAPAKTADSGRKPATTARKSPRPASKPPADLDDEWEQF